jgi:hypothetical protein
MAGARDVRHHRFHVIILVLTLQLTVIIVVHAAMSVPRGKIVLMECVPAPLVRQDVIINALVLQMTQIIVAVAVMFALKDRLAPMAVAQRTVLQVKRDAETNVSQSHKPVVIMSPARQDKDALLAVVNLVHQELLYVEILVAAHRI